MVEKTMDKIVALAKSRGFVYPGSEIYGGLANTWDYGNLGVELKNNVKRAWWKKFVQENPYNVGVDCAILMNPQTWIASGHLGGFSDPLMDCKECHERFRADKIIEEWPCKLMQVFGTAEGLLSFTSPEDEDSLIARCQGTPVSPADEVKIVDEEDKTVPEGVFGELLSRGPYTIDGYYMAEEANKKSFTPDGFYRTGDKAMWTKDGRLRLGGRIKEQINRAGEKIMPSEIEAYLCRHLEIKEAAVVGVPDETLGNRICAFLVTDDEAGIDLQEIHRFLREIGVAAYKMPDQIERVETWPLTSVGKIDKKALERMAQEK